MVGDRNAHCSVFVGEHNGTVSEALNSVVNKELHHDVEGCGLAVRAVFRNSTFFKILFKNLLKMN